MEKNTKPEMFLDENEMVNTLIELAILKATNTVASDIKRDSGINLKEYALEKYKIDSCVVIENIAYYGYKPQLLKKIYKRVQDSIKLRYQFHDSIFKHYTELETKENIIDSDNPEEWGDD